jgi:hypothetical protein
MSEKRIRAIQKRAKKKTINQTKIKEVQQHFHFFHDEAVAALKKTAVSMNITYEKVKQLFVIKNDIEITMLFWKYFEADNKNVDHTGIDYCHTCKKFIVHSR